MPKKPPIWSARFASTSIPPFSSTVTVERNAHRSTRIDFVCRRNAPPRRFSVGQPTVAKSKTTCPANPSPRLTLNSPTASLISALVHLKTANWRLRNRSTRLGAAPTTSIKPSLRWSAGLHCTFQGNRSAPTSLSGRQDLFGCFGTSPFERPTLRRPFPLALRRSAREVAADLRAAVVKRAEEIRRAVGCATDFQRRAVSVAHPHERAIFDKMCHAFRLAAQPRPVGAGHAHELLRPGETAGATAAAIGGDIHGKNVRAESAACRAARNRFDFPP
jgi:hypothetical protein